MLVLKKTLYEQLCRHAEKEYPFECCGIILGIRNSGKRIACEIIPSKNCCTDKTTGFRIDPVELIRAETEACGKGLEPIGFYHSHPDYEAVLSDKDKEGMMPEISFPVISVTDGRTAEIKSYERLDDNFLPEIVVSEE